MAHFVVFSYLKSALSVHTIGIYVVVVSLFILWHSTNINNTVIQSEIQP